MGGLFSKPAAPAPPPKPVQKVQKKEEEKVEKQMIEEEKKIHARRAARRTGGLRMLTSPVRVAEQEQKTKLGGGSTLT